MLGWKVGLILVSVFIFSGCFSIRPSVNKVVHQIVCVEERPTVEKCMDLIESKEEGEKDD